VSEWQILVTVDTPHWDDQDKEYLIGQVYNAVKQEVPKDHFTIQEFAK
jgi:hypothetical protein